MLMKYKDFKQLTKEEMKRVAGGNETAGCCSHNADWSYQNCGLTLQQAMDQASYYAQTNGAGNHGYYCCSSCNPPQQ
jgi:bacteriocin-like protein